MLQTKVKVTSQIRAGVGTSIAAFTGIGKIGIMDYMSVTTWQPPNICDVVHTGSIIKGTGRFELTQLNAQTSRFDWSEEIVATPAQFLLVAPGDYAGVGISLIALRRQLQQPE